MVNNYSPLLYFNEDTSLLEDAVQKSLKRKAKAHCVAIIEIISQLSDEVT